VTSVGFRFIYNYDSLYTVSPGLNPDNNNNNNNNNNKGNYKICY